MRLPLLTSLILLIPTLTAPAIAFDRLLANFETDSYEGWVAEGTAFGTAPARGSMKGQMPVTGFGIGEEPPLVAVYTGHGAGLQTQDLAFSRDRGRSWTKYTGNPVLDIGEADFRDPKVFWHADTGRWVMVVAMAGVLDGTAFVADSEASQWVDYGRDFYAPVSWSNIPETDGRRLWIGWMNNWETCLNPTSHPNSAEVELFATGGTAVFHNLQITPLRSVWHPGQAGSIP